MKLRQPTTTFHPGEPSTRHQGASTLAAMAEHGILVMNDEGRFLGGKTVTIKDAATQYNLIVQALSVRTK